MYNNIKLKILHAKAELLYAYFYKVSMTSILYL
jgi:hypothetical protein